MQKQTAQFLPFHAVNEFMRVDYRIEMIRFTLNSLSNLPKEYQTSIDRLTNENVKVPGFRTSSKAPVGLRVKPTSEAFEKKSQLVISILSAWAAARRELSEKVYTLLVERNWTPLPIESDRTKLPGFMISWPKGEDFQIINDAFNTKYPDTRDNSDDISLMVVWISNRLPYSSEGEKVEKGEKSEGPFGLKS
jgi:hypothetical protein